MYTCKYVMTSSSDLDYDQYVFETYQLLYNKEFKGSLNFLLSYNML